MVDKLGNRLHSAIFTPEPVAWEMAYLIPVDKLGPGRNILDPTCGSGNLLAAVIQYRQYLGVPNADIAAGTHGYDIQPEYVHMCRERLIGMLGEEHRAVIEENIQLKDFLA